MSKQSQDRQPPSRPELPEVPKSVPSPEKETPREGQLVDKGQLIDKERDREGEASSLLYLVNRSSPDLREGPAAHRVLSETPPPRPQPTAGKTQTPPVTQIDEYRIVEPLGRGGMGQVFLGRDTLLDRPVAVKFLSSTAPNERLRKRFLIEARAIARVQHPNVVAIYRVGISNGIPYLVTEHVAGSSLDRVPKPMPWEKAMAIGIDLLRGLKAVHRQGVLHRDLKPGNAMLTPEGTAKLLDFGLAKLEVELRELPLAFSRNLEPESPPLAPSSDAPLARAAGKLQDASARAAALTSTFMSSDDGPAEYEDDEQYEYANALTESGDPREQAQRAEQLKPEVAATFSQLDEDASSPQPPRPLTETGRLIGTPAYMPPEMWLGAPATEQSDLYMFGELIYELCCGHPPHAFRQRVELRRAAIHSDALALSQAAPKVNPRFAAVIDQCIRRDPQARPRAAAEVLVQLEAIAADPTDEATRRLRKRNEWLRRMVPLGLTIFALSLSAALVWRGSRERAEHAAITTPRPRVAVLGLRTSGVNAAALSSFARTFRELLSTELGAGEKLLVLSSETVDHAKLELGLDGAAGHPEDWLAKLERSLSPDLIAIGELRADNDRPDRLHVEVTIEDARSGQPTAKAQVQGSEQELFGMVQQAGQALRQQLGFYALSSNDRTQLQAERPASLEVARKYAEAKDRFAHFDYAGAQKLYANVVEAEPDFPLGHLGLADVLHALGYDQRARDEVRRAHELSRRLPRAARSLLEARYRETTGEWPKAFALYNALRTSFPDNAEYGFYLYDAQMRAEQPAEALDTVAALRRLRLSGAFAARVDLAEARADMEMSRFTEALTALEHAAQRAESLDSSLLLADILLQESFARISLSEHTRALRSAERARSLYEKAGNLYGEVQSLVAQSNATSELGDIARASEIDERTLQLAMQLGHTRLIATHLGNMAISLCTSGHLDLATARAQGGLLLAEQIGHQEPILQALITLGQVALLRGDLTLSEQQLTRAIAELPVPDDPRMSAWLSWHRAELRVAEGRFEEAAELHQAALAQREQNHLDGYAAESQAALAGLFLLRAQAQEAARLARAAMERFANGQSMDNAAWAQALLSQALAEQGQEGAALAAFAPALSRLSNSQNLLLRVRGITALVAAAAHLPALSNEQKDRLRAQARATLAQAQQFDFQPGAIELEVRLMELARGQNLQNPDRHDACLLSQRSRERGWLKAASLATAVCQHDAAHEAEPASRKGILK